MKKILTLVLVLVLALSCFAVMGVSAADEFTPSEEPIIYFEVPEDWQNYSRIFCHIWPYGKAPLANWQSKKEACTETDTAGVYAYDISKTGSTIEDGVYYCIIFSADTGMQTYDTLFTSECFGDTLYCDSTKLENPADSSKTSLCAFWKNQDKEVYGPVLTVTSIGNVIGLASPEGIEPADLFIDFLTSYKFENAQIYSGKDDQAIIDDAAEALNLTDDVVDRIITENSENVAWTLTWNGKTYGGTSSSDESTPDEPAGYLGDADGDGKVNVKDATAIQKYVAGFEITISDALSDADRNGAVNVKDATAIQKYVAGYEMSTPIGELVGQIIS